jgi:hypothetical protein
MAACKVSCLLQQSQTPGAGCICGAARTANRVSAFTDADRQMLADLLSNQMVLIEAVREFMASQVRFARAVTNYIEWNKR